MGIGIYYVALTLLAIQFQSEILGRKTYENYKTQLRQLFSNPDFLLSIFFLIISLNYFRRCKEAEGSLEALVLIASATFGCCVYVWLLYTKARSLSSSIFFNAEEKIFKRVSVIISILIILLASSALWQPDGLIEYRYHGFQRWNGVWNTPNIFGMLMGLGVVLSLGHFLLNVYLWISHKPLTALRHSYADTAISDHVRKICRMKDLAMSIIYLIAALLCGYGLFRSYSRGAWLGTISGLAYLAFSVLVAPQLSTNKNYWLKSKRNLISLSIIGLSLILFIFFQFRFSEYRPLQRIYSVFDVNDFSWRNRIVAWKGSVYLIAEKPIFGFGWNQYELEYKKMLPQRLDDLDAIHLNDVLLIGITNGIPALICFLVFIWLSLGHNIKQSCKPFSSRYPILTVFTICRAGVIVLFISFIFNDGLFLLSVGPIFWMLIYLSRLGSLVYLDNSKITTGNKMATFRLMPVIIQRRICPNNGATLSIITLIFGIMAIFQIFLHLYVPFLSVNKTTLTITRKYLVAPKESNDINFLSTNACWYKSNVGDLLENVSLSYYNRQLINWKYDDDKYKYFVLSPVIVGGSNELFNWRRLLWEELYPSIRHESSPDDAAKIIMRHLCERVRITTMSVQPHDVSTIWLKRITDEAGFEIINIAALRSVGIPARLDSNHDAEFWDGIKWQASTAPTVLTWQRLPSY
jgi:hypothetical protein